MQNTSKVLLSTAYFPPVEYFALLLKHNNAIIEINETYPKQTYRNRCLILSANGVLNLSIPVIKTNGNNTKTNDIAIHNSELWFLNHWKAIKTAYSNSPFFLYYKDDLEKFFTGNYDKLIDFNTELINELLSLIGIVCNITYSESFTTPNIELNDFRFTINPKSVNITDSGEKYIQVFSDKYDFIPNLSIIDLLFNLGPETKEYLKNISNLL